MQGREEDEQFSLWEIPGNDNDMIAGPLFRLKHLHNRVISTVVNPVWFACMQESTHTLATDSLYGSEYK